jgi:hypothetical protein
MYSHRQTGWVMFIGLAFGLVVIGVAGREIGPGSPGRGFLIASMALLALMVPLFGWLTVTVDNEAVTARFGIGLVRKRIALRNIKGAATVRNKWYYGWGLRMGPNGWMYNVSGLDAVEIELKEGGWFRIGTDEPQELVRMIRLGLSVG